MKTLGLELWITIFKKAKSNYPDTIFAEVADLLEELRERRKEGKE